MNLKFFIRNSSSERLKYCRKRVIFHEVGIVNISSQRPPCYRSLHYLAGPSYHWNLLHPGIFCDPNSIPLPLFLSFSSIPLPQPTHPQIVDILTADSLGWLFLGIYLLAYLLKMCAVLISKICAPVSAAPPRRAESPEECNRGLFCNTGDCRAIAYILASSADEALGNLLGSKEG